MAPKVVHEPDTDINNTVQKNRVYEPWPAMVHKFDAATGTFTHKRVENEREQATWLKAGWFKTPFDAESAATKGKPHRTNNDPGPDAEPAEPVDATDEIAQPGRRR